MNPNDTLNPGCTMMVNNIEEEKLLLDYLKPEMTVLEFGSGLSTIAIAKRVKSVVSIEHDYQFYQQSSVPDNVTLLFVPPNSEPKPEYDDGTYSDFQNYVRRPLSLPDHKFDVVFVDGRARVACAEYASRFYLKSGGAIFIHDYKHPQSAYRRQEYEEVEKFLKLESHIFAMARFSVLPENKWTDSDAVCDTNSCWHQKDLITEEMNTFHDSLLNSNQGIGHFSVFSRILSATDIKGCNLLDIGCGSGRISEFSKDFNYFGADLRHIISGCAMRNYPEMYYRSVNIETDSLAWVNNYPVVVADSVISVMKNPIEVLRRLLINVKEYLIIHRQQITETGETCSYKENVFSWGYTWQSVINREDLIQMLDTVDFDIMREEKIAETGSSSLLLRRRKSWALYNMDSVLYQKYFPGKENGFFIEAGANNGLRQSNTMYLEFYKNWKGILIEPVSEVMEECRKNRSPNNTYCQAALVAPGQSGGGISMLYTPDNYGLLSTIDNENAPELMKRVGDEKVIKVLVPAWSFNDMMLNFDLMPDVINFISLDMEGYELEALKGIDFDKYNIQYILIEQLTGGDDIEKHLAPWYTLVDKLSGHDFLYKRVS